MDNEGFISLEVILNFPRIIQLKATADDIRKACERSAYIQVNENKVSLSKVKEKWYMLVGAFCTILVCLLLPH